MKLQKLSQGFRLAHVLSVIGHCFIFNLETEAGFLIDSLHIS